MDEYICSVDQLLNNPVFYSLIGGDRHLGTGTDKVRYFNDAVSPFAGFEDGYKKGFDNLYEMLPAGRRILYATPRNIEPPGNWQLVVAIKGLQFVYENRQHFDISSSKLIPLQVKHVPQMVELAKLTKPGPFDVRTIEFGHYFGVFENDKLVAMTGQRLHVQQYSEISAVCTHPDHIGKGYGATLVQHAVNLILDQDKIPYLHVREDNERAIKLYQRLGFNVRSGMNFYFMKK